MRLFNKLIQDLESHLGKSSPRRYAFSPEKAWPETDGFEVVMLRDAALELGGDRKGGVSFTCVTTDPDLVDRDEILVYGKDLRDLKGDVPFARITLIQVGDIESDDEDDTEPAFRAIQNIDFVKYHVFPEGYMMRTSSESSREQVRVSKKALKEGISFEAVGNTFLKHYKRDINVVAVKQIFVTSEDADFSALQKDAKTAKDILLTLSSILKGLPTDCGSCALKPICDEVEGMKELHFGKESHTTE